MKKLAVFLVAAVMCLALPAMAFAATPSSSKLAPASITKVSSSAKALNIALKDAKLSKSMIYWIETDAERNTYEVEFTHKKNKTEYSYEISRSTGVILDKSIDFTYKRNSSKAKISKTAALKQVSKFSGIKYSVVKKAKCTYSYKKREGIYRVQFKHGNYRYEYELLAPTGKVIELEMERIRK